MSHVSFFFDKCFFISIFNRDFILFAEFYNYYWLPFIPLVVNKFHTISIFCSFSFLFCNILFLFSNDTFEKKCVSVLVSVLCLWFIVLCCLLLKIALLAGTKLQVIITKMHLDSCKESSVIKGTLLVKPSDEYFWFHRPEWLLHILQIILIQV